MPTTASSMMYSRVLRHADPKSILSQLVGI
jgi:hypothetical protein